ncbi:MAG TPA: gluconate 2-dehydrogenase subunit 3 family protein [Acetobacteraceae bacterium]|nr:gluconate 2-dehydrogenase subunit 3 family protein [Acetobacteraceae bacterium]
MPDHEQAGRYPGYDVLAKRNTPSWNDQTRRVIDQRLAVPGDPRFFTEDEFATVAAIAARLVPRRGGQPAIPVAALVDHKLFTGRSDGYRQAGMPRQGDAWRLGLQALDAEAQRAFGGRFRELGAAEQDELLKQMQSGELRDPAWGEMPAATFFSHRMAHDIVLACFSHPAAWSAVGWGGPASPRGYVRMDFDQRDPWEAVERRDGDHGAAQRKNRHVG